MNNNLLQFKFNTQKKVIITQSFISMAMNRVLHNQKNTRQKISTNSFRIQIVWQPWTILWKTNKIIMTSIALANVYSRRDDIILRATYFYFHITLNQIKRMKEKNEFGQNIAKRNLQTHTISRVIYSTQFMLYVIVYRYITDTWPQM